MVKTLIVAGKVKELCVYEKRTLNMSSDLNKEITETVKRIIERACRRAVENGRTTVMAKDI